MKITHDPQAKALYVQILERGKHWKTVSQNDGDVNIDYNTASEITGIEVLNVETEPTIERLSYRIREVKNMAKWKGAGMMMTIMLVPIFGWVAIVGLVIKPVPWVGALLCLFGGAAIGCLIAFLMRRWWFRPRRAGH